MLPMVALAGILAIALMLWRPVTGLVLFGLVAPLGMTQLPFSLDVVTVMSALVVALAAWEVLLSRHSLLPASTASIAASLWSLGIVASVAFSAEPGRAAVLGTWQILAAWTAIAVGFLARTPSRLSATLAAVLAGAIVVALTGLRQGLSTQGAFNGTVVEGRATGIFSQPNEYGLYCAMVWSFSLALACLSRGYIRWLAIICAVASLGGLAASFSRASWTGALLAAVVMAFLIPQTRRPQAIGLATIVGLLGIALVAVPYWNLPSLLVSRLTSIVGGQSNPYDNRPALMAEGVREWGQNVWLGIGPNMYPIESRTLQSPTRTLEGQHAHNLVLTIGAEQGLVGLLAVGLFAAAVISAFRGARRVAVLDAAPQRCPLGAAVSLSATAALVALLGAGIVDYPLRNAMTRATMWLLVGLTLAGQRCLTAQPRAAARHSSTDAQASTA